MNQKCESCKDEFFPRKGRKFPTFCRICASKIDAKLRYPKHLINLQTLTIDKKIFSAVDSTGIQLPLKMKFDYSCDACKIPYKASMIFERIKKHPWHCKSCAISLEWSDTNYRKSHVDQLLLAHGTIEARLRISILSKKNWSNPKIRRAMCESRDRFAAAQKGLTTKKENFLSGKTVYKVSHGKRQCTDGIWMRSTYETRFAVAMNQMNVEWKYEPRWFELPGNKLYLPDFFIPSLDLYVEIKGWWRDDAKEKFDSFRVTYPHVKVALIMIDQLKRLEKKEITVENCVI